MIALVNQWGKLWLDFFSFTVIQNTLFLCVVFLVLYILRNTSAQLRYFITLVGLVKLLVPPFLPSSFLYNLSSLPAQTVSETTMIPLNETVLHISDIKFPLQLNAMAFLIWLILTLIVFSFPLISTLRLRIKLKNAEPIDPVGLDILSGKSSVKVLKTEALNMPLTLGLFPRKIYLPTLWDQWTPDCRQMVLKHELAHIKRYDGAVQMLQIIAQAIYFFHPLVWLLSRRINEYREMACDDASVGYLQDSRVKYSKYLVEIAEKMVQTNLSCTPASALIRQKQKLYNRVQYQIKEVNMHNLSKWKILMILSSLLLLIVPFSWTKSKLGSSGRSVPSSSVGTKISETNDTGKIYGTVKNKETGNPMPGTNVFIEGTNIGAAADQDGNFWIINVPVGIHTLKATHIGFSTVIIKSIKVTKSESARFDIEMKPTVIGVNTSDTKKIPQKPAPPPPPTDNDIKFVPYDEPPMPVGGVKSIQNNLVYPESAKEAGIEGRVTIYTKISKEGHVVQTKVVQSVNPDCDKAAVEAIKSVQWKPAMQRDKPVDVWIAIPVDFRLKK